MIYQLSKLAQSDVEGIYTYSYTTFGERQAEKYHSAIEEGINHITKNPDIGQSLDFVQQNIKRLTLKHHSIYYKVSPDSILVLRILHQYMDIGKYL